MRLRLRHPIVWASALGVLIIGVTVSYVNWRQSNAQGFDVATVLPPPAQKKNSARTYSGDELATYDGKSGHRCFVAVDGVVYEIAQGRQWKDGQHIPSSGRVWCGRDLSQLILLSPHGKSKLKDLAVVGRYK